MIFHRSARLKLRPYGTVQICLLFLILLLLSHTIDSRNQRRRWWYALSFITYTHTRLMAHCPGWPGWAGTRKVKPVWILLKQEIVSGSGISRAICKSAPHSRQITMPAPHHSVFYRPDALPALPNECVCVCIVEWPPASSNEGNALPFMNQCQTTAEHWKHPDRKTLIKNNQPFNRNVQTIKNKLVRPCYKLQYLAARCQTWCHWLVGNTDDKLLMNGQLQRTHAGYHDYKAKIKLDGTDVISLQQHWVGNIFTYYLHTHTTHNCNCMMLR